jgi:hypothetical protein
MSAKASPGGELSIPALLAIVEATKSVLTEEQHSMLLAAILKLSHVVTLLQAAKVSITRLKRVIFGVTEKTSRILAKLNGAKEDEGKGKAPGADRHSKKESAKRRRSVGATGKPTRFGRYSSDDYTGATHQPINHADPSLQPGCQCHECQQGRLYELKPVKQLFLKGTPLVQAFVFHLQRLRCALCGTIFVAPPPPEVGDKKYDETVGAILGVAHYSGGVTLNTAAKLQADSGVPLPATTQSEILKDCTAAYKPVVDELRRQAADGELFFIDDTGNRVIGLTQEVREAMLGKLGKDATGRTGCFTTGIVSVKDSIKIALYKTGPLHAGENITELLLLRTPGLPLPLLMCDGLDRNEPQLPPGMSELAGRIQVILCQCNVHGRRGFADVAKAFPKQVAWVLRLLRKVYITDATAREKSLSPRDRLELHQKWSGPRMRLLKRWMDEQLAGRNVEPNSGLGAAIQYMQKRWDALTRFLTTPGAPLDNNFAERVLKAAIKHRRNSLFHRTMNGAGYGDTHLSLIHTAQLNGVSAQQYLLALLRHRREVAERPGEWMPWNFQATLARLEAGPGPPAQAVRATPVQAVA